MQETRDFEYLRGIAKRYGHMYAVHEFNAAADNMTAEQLQEVREVYAIICEGDNRAWIENWVGGCLERRAKIPKKEFDFAMQVGQLFVFFDYLVRRGIQPFCDRETAYARPAPKPNWENLPKELAYLIEPAETFANYDDVERNDFLNHPHPKDMELLAATAERMRLNGHSRDLHEWFVKFQLSKHQEAAMIYSLLGVMDNAGLNFEPSPD